MKTLFLVGYMAVGKTSYGRQIAADTGLPFIDLDEYIEREKGMSVAAIFASEGEEKFRVLESEALRRLGEQGNLVVATGGGTPCHHGNMDYMNRVGTTLWLDGSIPYLLHYLRQERASRPLLRDIPEERLPSFIESHLASRMPYYSKARFRLRLGHETPEHQKEKDPKEGSGNRPQGGEGE